MKRTMVCGLMALLTVSAAVAALADPPGDRRPASGPHASAGPGPGGPGRPGGGGPSPGRPSSGGPSPGRPGGGGGSSPGKPGGDHPTPGKPGGHHPTPGKPGHRPSPGKPGHHPTPGKPGEHHPGGSRPPPRPGYRPPNRPIYGWNHHRYRAGTFRYPAGFGYRRWSVGQSLPALLFSSTYYFTNYAALGLDVPPYGYQWVRYGPDVMLVNIRTGEILDVINNTFY